MLERLGAHIELVGSGMLVSGGAAFAEHLAVTAFLRGYVKDLELHIPAAFEQGRYRETPHLSWDSGGILNRYHREFSRASGIDSLSELSEAIKLGATVLLTPGFKQRNSKVAERSDHLIAFTFGKNQAPRILNNEGAGKNTARLSGLKPGGTADTWDKAAGAQSRLHVSLTWLMENPGVGLEDPKEGVAQPTLF